MDDAADNYSAAGGGNEWEVVSLTASTYAAAPGPVLPLPLDAHKKTEYVSTCCCFCNLHVPAAEALSADLSGGRDHQLTPATATATATARAMVDDGAVDTDDLDMPCPESACGTEMQGDDGLARYSDLHKNTVSTTLSSEDANSFADAGNALLQAGAIPVCLPGEGERQATTSVVGFSTTQPDAAGSDTTSVHQHVTAGSDSVINVVDSASLSAAHDVPVAGVARVAPNKGGPSSSKIPCEAQAWWNRTFRFLRNNSKESLTFSFIFVAATIVGLAVLGQRDKVQLRLEFNVDSEKISCAVREPLGQVKLNMLVGGSPVAQG